jgi:hypothetical protein
MGMYATYRRMTPKEFEQTLEAVREQPYLFHPFTESEPTTPEELEAERVAGRVCRLEKEWHALHFLLTGDASLDPPSPVPPPLGNVVFGGTPTPIEAGIGSVRYLNPNEVREVADVLSAIPTAELQRRFNPEAFNERRIYPMPRPGGWDEEQLEPLLEIYPEFVEFFRQAAGAGEVVLLSVD